MVVRCYLPELAMVIILVCMALLLLVLHLPAPRSHHITLAFAISRRKSNLSGIRRKIQPILVKDIYVTGYDSPHPELCPYLGEKIRLLILIMSAPEQFAARDAIRMTWGHYAVRSDISIGFVIGIPPNTIKSKIVAEDMLYGDIIMGRFVDSYSNLTLKTLSMLDWAHTYCPRAPKILKADDDVFINVPALIEFAETPTRIKTKRTIWGRVIKKGVVNRNNPQKTIVPHEQYPGKLFPDFTTGPAYLLTNDVVKDILKAAPKERFMKLEDVFITGILGNKLGIIRQHSQKFHNSYMNSIRVCIVKRSVSVHLARYDKQFEYWKKLQCGRMNCLKTM